ncbi:MAG: hypothetical protein KBD00_05110 [Candidatus Peribacteraceae bacterium]|nr:hypothetical protein [Candidatus Peribacteraceae bacterium]
MTPPKQEIISEKLVDEIVKASASPVANRLENLKKSMKPIDDVAAPKERKEALNMLKQTIDRKTMNEIQKKMIMEQVDEKIQMIDTQLQALEKREQELEAEAKKVKLADTTKQPETSTLTKIKNAVDELPKGVKVAAAGGIAIGLFLGIRSLFSKAKNGAKNTVSAIGSGIAKLQFALMVALVGVGGVLGFKAWEKFRKLESSIKEAKEKAAAMAEAAAKMTADAKKAAEQKAKEAADAAKSLAEKTKDAAADPKNKERAQKAGEVVLEATEYTLLSRGLLSYYPTDNWQFDTMTKRRFVQDFLDLNKETEMKEIFESEGTLSSGIKMPGNSEDPKNRTEAANFIIHICKENRDRMLASKKGDASKLGKLQLKDFIHETFGSFQSIGSWLERLETAKGDLSTFVDPKAMDEVTKHDSGLLKELQEVIQEKYSGKTMPDIQLETLSAAGRLNGTVKGFISNEKNSDDLALKETVDICKSLEERKIHIFLLPFFHKVLPTQDWDATNMKRNEDAVKTLLLESMSVSQALRMLMYVRMMQKGNPAGLVMIQAEIISFVAQKEKERGQPQSKQILIRATEVAAGASWKELEDMNLDVDPTLLEKAKKGLNAVFPKALAITIHAGTEGVFQGKGTIQAIIQEAWDKLNNAPLSDKIIYGGGAAGGLIAGEEALRRGLNIVNVKTVNNMRFIEAMKQGAKHKNKLRMLQRSNALVKNRDNAAKVLDALNNALEKVDPRKYEEGMNKGQKLLNGFLRSSRSIYDYTDLRTKLGVLTPAVENALNDLGDSDILKTLQKFKLGDRLFSAPLRIIGIDRLINTKNFEAAIDAAKVSKDAVVSALKGIGMSPAVLSKFLATSNAMQMLVKAAANGGAKAATAVINLGGRALSLVGKAGTVLAVPFDVAICLVEVLEAKKQIAGTNNESIQDIYKEDINFNVATTTIGVASTLVSGAFATAGTLAALPIALAAMGTKYTHKQLRDAALTWVKDDRDYAKETDAVLMQKLQDLAPGNFGGLGGGIVYSIDYLDKKDGRTSFNQAAEESFKGIQDANAGARFNICRALVVRNAFIAPSDKESAQEFQNKFDRQVMDEMQYIGNKTQGKFDLTNPDLFLQAKRHADLLAMSRVAKQSNESPKLEWKDGDKTESFDIKDYEDLWKKSDDPAENTRREALRSRLPEEYRKQVEVPMKLIAINAKLEDSKDAAPLISQALLQDLTIPLSKLDAQINATDFPGMWDGVTDHYDRDLSRYMAFSGIADTLDEAVADAIENGEMSVEEYDLAMQKVRSKVQSSPLDHFKAGQLAKPNIESFRNRDDLLTPNGILAALFERPESVSKAA